MTTHSHLRLLLLASLGPLLAAPAWAQEGGYLYGGLSLGQSRAKIDQDRIAAGLLGAGLTSTSFTRDERGDAYRVFGGLQMNRHLALEAAYFDLGRFGFSTTTQPAGTLDGQIRLKGASLDLVGTLPLTERLSLIGRVGAQSARASDRFSGTGAVFVTNPNPSKREVNGKYGAGLQYEFSPAFLLRAEAERYRINDAVGNHGHVKTVSLSLVFPFGRSAAPAPRMAAAPAWVAPMPAPPPAPPAVVVTVVEPVAVMAQPLPAPERRRVSFSAESLFGFDRSTLRPESLPLLDRFAAELRSMRFDSISVEGHTDRLGTPDYNQQLSQRRAEAVKAYLVGPGGIDAAKVSATGKGESTPETRPGDCIGDRPTAKLVACLQPDRRVETEVTGTR